MDTSSHNSRSEASRSFRGSIALSLVLLLLGTGSMYWSRAALREVAATQTAARKPAPPLYLPDVKYVRLITLGFDRFFSDILWFNTLNYFGKHFEGDKDFRWLGQMCDLVTSLDSQAEHVYEFCSTLLSWVARDPDYSTKLLAKAIASRPDYWRYHYLRGFNNWYFLSRKDLAKKDFTRASKLPGAPAFLGSLASRLMVEQDDPETAIRFLKDLIEQTRDQSAKEALQEKLAMAYISRDVQVIERKLTEYAQRFGKRADELQELVRAGVLPAMPLDPYRKPYYIDRESGEVRSKSGKKGLAFFGKTAETGLARKEQLP